MAMPSSTLALELLKLEAGQVVAIEAIGVLCPFGMPMGWPVDPVHRVA
jgi:hypothetical protein